MKIGRNDPCPCGSGRKYKHCHLKLDEAAAAPPPPADDGAVPLALDWLMRHHRKALKAAFEALIDDLSPAGADPGALDAEAAQALQINLTEWLLAEGELLVRGRHRRIASLLLGPDGPALNASQRGWIEQLARQPLRLYGVTGVVPGAQVTLTDALDIDAAPVTVHEVAGSRELRPGTTLGARVVEAGGVHVLSGALYPFPALSGGAVVADTRARLADAHADDRGELLSTAIVAAWLRELFGLQPLPKLVDASTGEPLLLVSDHYRVRQPDALTAVLDGCPELTRGGDGGWVRLVQGADGLDRALLTIHAGRAADRIEVFYRTQRFADEGRPWFEALAGDAVRFLTREIVDPRSRKALTAAGASMSADAGAALPPEALADAIEQIMQRHYANWADEPIAALDGRTPREAIATPGGLERVKGLLRSYEDGEARMAASQQRRVVSYRFLWEALGIEP